MWLSALSVFDEARIVELRCARAGQRLALELREADASDLRRSTAEAGFDDVTCKAERFEELRAAIRRHIGDAHLGHDLQHAVLSRFAEPQLRFRGSWTVTPELVGRCERRDGLQGEAGADRIRAVPQQASEVVRLAHVIGDDDDRGRRTSTGRDEPLVDGTNREHRRNRGLVYRYVLEQEDRRVRRECLVAEPCACVP